MTRIATTITERLGIALPIIQAPMAGGGDTPALVSAVCEAGGIGFIGVAYSEPAQVIEAARAVRSRTNRPFGINVFAPVAAPAAPPQVSRALERLARYYEALGIAPPPPPAPRADGIDRQIEAVLQTDAAAFSFTFGPIPDSAMHAVKQRFFVIGTATTVGEAVELERRGVDAVIAQGAEAGGHRGTFAVPFEHGMVGTMALVPQVASSVGVPVIASGGIMDGRGIAAALALGASAVQMGTAFLACHESGIPAAYRDALTSATEARTAITRAFSGRPARGIANRFMEEMRDAGDDILPFPLQNALTRPLRDAAARQGRAEFLSLWAGQGVGLARSMRAADLVARLAAETGAVLESLGRIALHHEGADTGNTGKNTRGAL